MASIDGAPRPGETLAGKYVLRELIGEGGMGLVFRADQPTPGQPVAIKVLHPALAANEALVRRFHNEAAAARRVQHPGVIAIFDAGTTAAGVPFIAMEHIDGRPLGTVIAKDEIPLPRALDLADQILRALDAAHERGVVHADVKSDNVLVQDTAKGEVLTLIDFGLARIGAPWDNGGFVSGTPEYMAPELVRGEPPTIASDIYGAGVILYELLTGLRPFGGASTDEILTRQLEEDPVPPSLRRPDRDLPAALDEIVLRALAKDPGARFASASELARALDRLAVLLAELYEQAGQHRRARRVLAVTDRHATILEVAAPGQAAEPPARPTIPELPHLLRQAGAARAALTPGRRA